MYDDKRFAVAGLQQSYDRTSKMDNSNHHWKNSGCDEMTTVPCDRLFAP